MLPLLSPRILYSDELQIIICIAQASESVAQCGTSWMAAESSTPDPVINIRALNMHTIIPLESFTCPVFQPNFPNVFRPWSMLEIAEFCKTNIILICDRFQDSLRELFDITSPQLWTFDLRSSYHVLDMRHSHFPKLVINTSHNLSRLGGVKPCSIERYRHPSFCLISLNQLFQLFLGQSLTKSWIKAFYWAPEGSLNDGYEPTKSLTGVHYITRSAWDIV